MSSNSDYKDFITQRHSKIKTDDKIIDAAIEKALKYKVKNKVRIIEGESNEVYEITLSNENSVIVRIASHSKGRFIQEQIAIELCRKVGVPAPKVLYVGQLPNTDNRQIIIEEKLRGHSFLAVCKSLSKEKIKILGRKCGEILSRIHTIPIKGYGWLDKNGNGTYKNQIEYIWLERERKEKLYLSISKKINFDPAIIYKSLNVLNKYLNLYKNEESVLLHNDYGPKHIFVKDEEITGIIDFENAGGGDPIRDLSRYDYFYSETIPTELLIKGYIDKTIFDNNFSIKMHLYGIYNSLGFLEYYDQTENFGGLDYTKKMIYKDIEFFDTL